MGAFSGIDNNEAFWMFDKPATDWKARRPVSVSDDIERTR